MVRIGRVVYVFLHHPSHHDLRGSFHVPQVPPQVRSRQEDTTHDTQNRRRVGIIILYSWAIISPDHVWPPGQGELQGLWAGDDVVRALGHHHLVLPAPPYHGYYVHINSESIGGSA